MEEDFIQYERNGYGFRYYFNAGIDKVTGNCDEEGVDVYEKDSKDEFHYIASLPHKSIDDIADMTDDEFEEVLAEHGVL